MRQTELMMSQMRAAFTEVAHRRKARRVYLCDLRRACACMSDSEFRSALAAGYTYGHVRLYERVGEGDHLTPRRLAAGVDIMGTRMTAVEMVLGWGVLGR